MGQLAGAWITLTWSSPQTISRIVLYDRINLTDQVLGGTLQFSDGTSLPVGALPNDGTGYPLDFPAKTVNWVTFQVTGATGGSAGLAEFEAYTPGSFAPSITSGPTATPAAILDSQTSNLSVTASDPNGDPLSYSWSATGGTVTGMGATAVYHPPLVTETTTYRVDVTVSDGMGGTATGSVNITVSHTVGNNPPVITSGPVASPAAILDSATSNLSVTASDPDGNPLSYSWSATGGTVTGTGASVLYVPPLVTQTTTYRVDVTVNDGLGGTVAGSVNITVSPSGIARNIALFATATASSQNTTTGQTASKAIDGVVSGYPLDSTREWATVGQLAGAWCTTTPRP